jgi:hypothetical protein
MTDTEIILMVKNMAKEMIEKTSVKNGQLLGSSPSLDMMKKLIADYWYGNPDDYSFTEIGTDRWSVSSKTGVKSGVEVVKKNGRYRFERV